MQGRYSHARQMKRSARQTRKLKTYLGRVVRDIDRKALNKDAELMQVLAQANRLLSQTKKSKNKLYSIHAPEVECISKGKVHKRYEFGNKVSFVTTSKSNWLVGAMSLQGSPYDGHTLEKAVDQVNALTDKRVKNVYCDQGYRGHGIDKKADSKRNIKIVGRIPKRATRTQRKWLKRRAAIEPIIGHLKSGHRLSRNHLKGVKGNQANTVLAAAGYNMAKLLAWFCYVWICVMNRCKPILRKDKHGNIGDSTELLFISSSLMNTAMNTV